jgi:hypothetical protein
MFFYCAVFIFQCLSSVFATEQNKDLTLNSNDPSLGHSSVPAEDERKDIRETLWNLFFKNDLQRSIFLPPERRDINLTGLLSTPPFRDILPFTDHSLSYSLSPYLHYHDELKLLKDYMWNFYGVHDDYPALPSFYNNSSTAFPLSDLEFEKIKLVFKLWLIMDVKGIFVIVGVDHENGLAVYDTSSKKLIRMRDHFKIFPLASTIHRHPAFILLWDHLTINCNLNSNNIAQAIINAAQEEHYTNVKFEVTKDDGQNFYLGATSGELSVKIRIEGRFLVLHDKITKRDICFGDEGLDNY